MLTRGAARLAWRSRSRSSAVATAALHALPGDHHAQSPAPMGVAHLHVLATACRRPLVVAAPELLARGQFTIANDDHDVDDDDDDDDELPPRVRCGGTGHAVADEYLETLHHASESQNGGHIALNIFHEIQAANGDGLTVDVATALIELLGARKRGSECIAVLRYARDAGVRPRIHAYSSAIACCYHEQQYVHALKIFEVMRNDGYVPKVVTYSRALSAALKAAQHELVLEIFDDMLRHKVETSIVIYNNILNSCARVGDGHSALGVFRAIKQRELPMTQSTYHSLAICAGKTGLAELALEMLASLQRDGFAPTMTIYKSAISACAKSRRWRAIVNVYDAMADDDRAQLTGVYLGGVIMALAKSPEPARRLYAIDLFNARKDAGEDLNLFAHNAALTALLESKQYDAVHALAKAMKRDGVEWDTLTYQTSVFASIRSGDVSTALHMLHAHAKKMLKSTECYRELIRYYAEERKNPREACRVTMQMMQNNPRLSRLDWHNALTHALELPDRALYWNFRKWMAIRAAGIVHEVPAHLLLPDETKKLKNPKQQLGGEEASKPKPSGQQQRRPRGGQQHREKP